MNFKTLIAFILMASPALADQKIGDLWDAPVPQWTMFKDGADGWYHGSVTEAYDKGHTGWTFKVYKHTNYGKADHVTKELYGFAICSVQENTTLPVGFYVFEADGTPVIDLHRYPKIEQYHVGWAGMYSAWDHICSLPRRGH